MIRKPRGFEFSGYVHVDTAQILIADPCYIIGSDKGHVPDTWDGYCDCLSEQGYFWNASGHHQLISSSRDTFEVGVVVLSGDGDGTYPVFVRQGRSPKDGSIRPQEVRILFF